MVGFGYSSESLVVEIFDPSGVNAICSFNHQNVKFNEDGLGGGLTIAGDPMICGGGEDHKQCQVFSQGEWKIGPPLLVGAKFFGISSSPFEHGAGSEIFITGKNNGTIKTEVSY